MKANPVTLKDIAQELGITVATVSRALKDYPDISPKTKQAVIALAEKLKYRPNPIALNLRKKRSNIIGVITPHVVHHFFSTIISGIMEAADEADYTIMICQTNESYAREVREAGVLLNSRVDGLLISLSNETQQYEHLQEFQNYGIPIVLFDKVSDDLGVSKVVVDDYQGAFQAVEHLIAQGCRRIALLRGPLIASNSLLRQKGYLEALKKYNITIDEDLILECQDFDHEEGLRFASRLSSLDNPPDGVFAVADAVAIGAMVGFKQIGWRIPEDMAVVGFSDWQIASLIEPPLSSVYQPGFEMGKKAANLLLQEIENAKDTDTEDTQEKAPLTEVLDTHLVIRQSSLRLFNSSPGKQTIFREKDLI